MIGGVGIESDPLNVGLDRNRKVLAKKTLFMLSVNLIGETPLPAILKLTLVHDDDILASSVTNHRNRPRGGCTVYLDTVVS